MVLGSMLLQATSRSLPSDLEWLVVMSAVVAFLMAFGIGANDVANAFATSVGSKAITLKQAVMIAAVMEFAGAFLLGAHVTNTIRSNIANVKEFSSRPDILMLGMFCALIGASAWLLIATRLSLAVSTTHSIIGAIIGFALVAKGDDAVVWKDVGFIVLSWFASPILSGILSILLFYTVRATILRHQNSAERAITFYPILVGLTFGINVFFIIFKGVPRFNVSKMPFWQGILISLAFGAGFGLISHVFAVPWIRRQLDRWQMEQQTESIEEGRSAAAIGMNNIVPSGAAEHAADSDSDGVPKKPAKEMLSSSAFKMLTNGINYNVHESVADDEIVSGLHANAEVFDAKTERMFSYLQVFTAAFDSFAHGANDVANAIAPLASIYFIYQTGTIKSKSEVDTWILALGGAGIVVGLALYGWRIIAELGVKLVKVTPSRGFSIELGAALIVVLASRAGIPVSTTHCQVGATIAVGLAETNGGRVNIPVMLKTFLGWVITLLFAGFVTAGIFSVIAYSPTLLATA